MQKSLNINAKWHKNMVIGGLVAASTVWLAAPGGKSLEEGGLGNGGLLDVCLSSFAEVNMAQKVSWTRQKSSWKGLHIMVGAKSIFEGCPARNHYFWGRRRSPNHPEIPLRLCRHGVAAFSECRKGVGENLGGNRVANRVAQRNVYRLPATGT